MLIIIRSVHHLIYIIIITNRSKTYYRLSSARATGACAEELITFEHRTMKHDNYNIILLLCRLYEIIIIIIVHYYVLYNNCLEDPLKYVSDNSSSYFFLVYNFK